MTEKRKKTLPELYARSYELIQNYYMRKGLEGLNAGKGQGKILGIIREAGEVSQKELAAKASMTPQAVSEFLKKLEAGGMITRTPDAWDKRITRITLTDKGRNAVLYRQDEAEIFSCLTPEEQEEFGGYLERVCRNTLKLTAQMQYDKDNKI